MFIAIQMSGTGWRSGFATEQAAYEWIENNVVCESCVWSKKLRPWEPSSCGAEWDVMTEYAGYEYDFDSAEEWTMNRKRRGFEFTVFGFTFAVGRAAGLLCVHKKTWCLHFLIPRKTFWTWGIARDTDWETFVGLGPLFLFIKE